VTIGGDERRIMSNRLKADGWPPQMVICMHAFLHFNLAAKILQLRKPTWNQNQRAAMLMWTRNASDVSTYEKSASRTHLHTHPFSSMSTSLIFDNSNTQTGTVNTNKNAWNGGGMKICSYIKWWTLQKVGLLTPYKYISRHEHALCRHRYFIFKNI